jgi:hypothetical protein
MMPRSEDCMAASNVIFQGCHPPARPGLRNIQGHRNQCGDQHAGGDSLPASVRDTCA